MLRNYPLCEEAGEGAPGEGKPGEGAPKDDAGKQQIELLTKSVGLLAQGLEELRGSNQKISETLEAVRKGAEPPAPKSKSIQEELDEKGDELETMGNKEMIAFLVEKLTGHFDNRVKELTGTVDEKVGQLAQQFHGKTTSEEVQKMVDKNADFMEWAPEMKLVLREHPNMSVQRAYTLVREENPQKKAEMTKKYAKPLEGTKPKSYGLTPTSSRESGTGKMNPREAAEKAFDEIMGNLAVGDVQLP